MMTTNKQTLGVIGNPISHSKSPDMHNTVITALGLDYNYMPFLIENESDLGPFIEIMRTVPIRGVNVTVPYKEAVIPFLDHCDPMAMKVGAVNTIVNDNGVLTGYNTDGLGFIKSLEADSGFDSKGAKVVLLGAGGAAKGLALALIEAGIQELVILNRTVERAKDLQYRLEEWCKIPIFVGDYDSVQGDSILTYLKRAQLVVQTSSVGMYPDINGCVLTDFSWVSPGHVCYDIVYKPKQTRFMKEVLERGGRVIGGAGMLAGQGAEAFQLFTGYVADYGVMKEIVENG